MYQQPDLNTYEQYSYLIYIWTQLEKEHSLWNILLNCKSVQECIHMNGQVTQHLTTSTTNIINFLQQL